MPCVTVGQENSGSIDLYYEDHGSGPTVVLIHVYPLSGRSWDKQVPVLLEAGCRVIAYDRRVMGRSSQPTWGYGYDTFAADLDAVMQALDLNDATIVGHSMGTGEVTRYLGTYGSARVSSGVLVSPIPPFLLQTDHNPEGLPQSIFDNFTEAAKADMPAWMTTFLNNFFSTGSKRDTGVSDQAFQANWNLAITASGTAAVDCIGAWLTDFREDLPQIDVPLMVIQATPTRCCRSRRPASASASLPTTSTSLSSRAPRTRSRGLTPRRSTTRSSGSSALMPRPSLTDPYRFRWSRSTRRRDQRCLHPKAGSASPPATSSHAGSRPSSATHTGRLSEQRRTDIGSGEWSAHHQCASQPLKTENRSAMCDNSRVRA